MGPIIGWTIIAAGVFSVCGGVFDWDFFMNSRKARPLVAFFSRDGARLFYVLLGLFVIFFGFLFVMGILRPRYHV